MNEKHVTFLIRQIRTYLDELESEICNHPEDYLPKDNLYSEIKLYNQWRDTDGWTD